MTIRQAPRRKAVQRLLSATLALVLSAWVYPLLAATGTDVRSDQLMDAPPTFLSADRKFPIQTIDHGAASAAGGKSLPLDESAAEAATQTTEQPTGPQFEIMLRRIFDETQTSQPKLQQQEDDDFNAPLAVDKSETLEDTPGVLEADPADAAAQFHGFRDDEILRYRRQMYRTDI